MTAVTKLVKGEKVPVPVALIGGSGTGWVTADPATDGLMIIPKVGVEAVILSDKELADFGYVRKEVETRASLPSPTDKPKQKSARQRQQRGGGSKKSR